jgi:hypothetical protein
MRATWIVTATFLAVIIVCGSVTFAQPVSFTRTDIPTGLSMNGPLVAADFTGDGMLDLLVNSHSLAENFGIYLLVGNGDGTFAPPARVFAPPFGSALNVADVNGDGRLDILFLSIDFELWVLLGDGTGAFQTLVRSPGIGASGRSLVVADLNRDGKPDIALCNQNGGVTIALGNGDGSFNAGGTFPIGGGVVANGLAAADLNGDGNVDLAATNPGAPDLFQGTTVSVLLGRGDGTFGPPTDFLVGTTPQAVIATDFNRDGNIDLAVVNVFGHGVSVLLGQGNGTFLPKTDYTTDAFPVAVAAADLNGDSHLDFAVCAPPDVLSIFAGKGDGNFGARQDVAAAGACGSIATGDFNHDGRTDVAVIYPGPPGPVSIFLNATTPPDTIPPLVTATATPTVLWPPNGKTTSVIVTGTVSDEGSGVDVSSGRFVVTDEYGILQPSGGVSIAADGTFSIAIPLAASRRGNDDDGRTYTIAISATDRAGNVGSSDVRVIVPHDRAHIGGH